MAVVDVTAQFPLEPGWPRLVQRTATVTVIHHTAVEPNQGEALLLPAAQMSRADELNHIRVIHLYHKSLGWGGFAYHGITFPSGRSYAVTPLTRWGAHVAGQNQNKYGWVLAGDFRDRLPGVIQVAATRDAVAELGKPIKPHNAYGGTTCPGRVTEVLDQLKEEGMALTDEDKVWIREKIEGVKRFVQDAHDVTRAKIAPSVGPTPEEITEAVKEAHREGTG
jgi:hypothetical protein